jgi:hypothetical protein
MIPGPYALCRIHLPEDADYPSYITVRYGYDTAKQAWDARATLAAEEGIEETALAVVRPINPDEIDRFIS